ncbi:unnamed protein product [Pleuronectes platessa]|uniref:Uncharacterized protein n=1 Tax=Pleuronectes platessa TaxID=8262 RepID=A0A9N7UXP7_PLEPL|nr:unnamed protein product [Pleuronectes platessa]
MWKESSETIGSDSAKKNLRHVLTEITRCQTTAHEASGARCYLAAASVLISGIRGKVFTETVQPQKS